MTIDSLPPAPTRGDSVNFAAVADTFVAALPTFASQANAAAIAMDDAVATAIAQASAAAASATSAATSASNAATSATSAATSASTASTQASAATTQATAAAASASAAAASAAAVAAGTIAGNLTFSAAGARIIGDFSNATIASRVMFQTSTTNGITNLFCIPNGTATQSQIGSFNSSDPGNAALTQLITNSTEGRVTVTKTGTGSFLPLAIFVNNLEQVRVDLLGQVKYTDPAFAITKTQALCKFGAFTNVANGAGANAFQAISVNGTLAGTTYANFLATATPDVVAVSGWAMRGGAGSNPLVTGNLGAWFENNAHIVWTLEVDCNNEGSSNTTYGDHNRGVGIMVNTGSTYSPDTGIWIHRQTGAGTAPGWQRGIMIDGARQVGIEIQAMAAATYPGMTPAAPGTITALQVEVSGDAQARFYITETGRHAWGSGSAAADLYLEREAAGRFRMSSDINSYVGGTTLDLASAVNTGATTLAGLRSVGKNSSGTGIAYTEITSVIGTATAGSEASTIAFYTYLAGASGSRMALGAGMTVGAPTGGDKGVGTINCAGDIYKNNAAYTNPDYVFEHAYTGSIDRFAANDGAAGYAGLRSLAEVERITRETLRLPGITDNAMGMFSRTDFLLEKTEEIFLHLFDHEKRITALAA